MSTYGTMKTRIASEILRDSWADTYVANAIQDAIKVYEGQRFKFNVNRFKLSTVASQDEYTVPSDIKTAAGSALATGETLIEIDGMTLVYNNSTSPIEPTTEAWLEKYQSRLVTGQPCYYVFVGTRLRFAPIPDQIYTIYIAGTKTLSTLSSGSDTNSWMVDGERLIRHAAKRMLYSDILRNPGQAAESEKMEAQAYAELKRKATAQASNTLQAWGY